MGDPTTTPDNDIETPTTGGHDEGAPMEHDGETDINSDDAEHDPEEDDDGGEA